MRRPKGVQNHLAITEDRLPLSGVSDIELWKIFAEQLFELCLYLDYSN